MMLRALLLFVMLLFLPLDARAENPRISADLAKSYISITSGFSGEALEVFGVRKGRGDVAVLFLGPRRDMVVRRKDQVLGSWINRSSVRFEGMPNYYDYALSRPAEALAPADVLRRYGIGPEYLSFTSDEERDVSVYREGLLRNWQEAGLYAAQPRDVQFLDDGFFKVVFDVSANVHVGMYEIQVLYFENGALAGQVILPLQIGHVGLNAGILSFSESHALIYGFACVFFALFAGWVSNRLSYRY